MENAVVKTPWNWEHTYAELPQACFTLVNPVPVKQPRLYVFNHTLAEELGLDPLSALSPGDLAQHLSGNRLPPGSRPLAMAYAGHQFGHFVVLGDGRAVLLGEHIDPRGHRHDIQLKGSGRNPYSRNGDGRAALGPMLREFLLSEAMAALGIPTTRSLAVIETGETVFRNQPLPGAILVRTAASHLRVGTFALFAALGDQDSLKSLLDHAIERHYPELATAPNRALALLEAVGQRQAELVARWMAVGFVHGVLNSDNVALSGETIDYGPCAFIDRYHPGAVFSSIDSRGRYAFANQAPITVWNLARFAESLLTLIDPTPEKAIPMAEEVLAKFEEAHRQAWLEKMRPKFGIANAEAGDSALIEDWFGLLHKHRLDFTNTFRALSGDPVPEQSVLAHRDFITWRQKLDQRLAQTGKTEEEIQQIRDAHNPRHIPRNHAVQKALDAAEAGNSGPFEEALEILRHPFRASADSQLFARTPEEDDQQCTTYCGT